MPFDNGGNLVHLFRVHPDHTGIIAAPGTPTTLITAPTVADAAYTFGGTTNPNEKFIIKSQWSPGENSATLAIDHVGQYRSDFLTFINQAAPFRRGAAATANTTIVYSEDGSASYGGGGSSSNGAQYLAVHYGGHDGTNCIVQFAIVTVAVTAMAEHTYNTLQQSTVTLTSVPAKAAFVIDKDILSTAKVTTPGSDLTMPIDTYLWQQLIPKAA